MIGRYQNPYLECDVSHMRQMGVHLARRPSGGGAVYQDLGNSIYTFLSSRALFSKQDNFHVIKRAMLSLGYSVDVSGRNDMTIFVPDWSLLGDDDRWSRNEHHGGSGASSRVVSPNSGFIPGCDLKISGSAFKAMSHAELQHGTLLVDVDVDQMTKILTPNMLKLQSKGVSSVRSRVINLKSVPDLMNRTIEQYGEGVLLRKNPSTGKYEETDVRLEKHTYAQTMDHDVICQALHNSFVQYHAEGGPDGSGAPSNTEVQVLNSDDLFTSDIRDRIAQMSDEEWRFGASPKFNIQFTKKFPFALVDVHIDKVSHQSIIDNIDIFTDSLAIEWVPVLVSELRGVAFRRVDLMRAGVAAGEKLSGEDARICQEVAEWICQELHLS